MNSALGDNAVSYIEFFLTPEEKEESNRRVAAIDEKILARQEKNKRRQEIEKISVAK